MKHAAYDIRPGSPADLETFREVFQSAYGRPADAEYFRRKWSTAYSGREMIAHIAHGADGKPVAFYGVYPQLLRKGGTTLLAAQAGDAATLPEARRTGLFRALATATEQACHAQGIQALFGFAQHQRGSFIGLVDMGWKHLADLTIHRWLTRVPIAMRINRKLSAKKFRSQMATQWDAQTLGADDLGAVDLEHSLAAPHAGWQGVRSVAFLRYKCALGSRVVRLPSGHAWLAVQGNTARIGDLFGTDHARLLGDLIALCRSHGVDVLELTTTRDRIIAPLLTDVPADSHSFSGGLIMKALGDTIIQADDRFLFTGGDVDTF